MHVATENVVKVLVWLPGLNPLFSGSMRQVGNLFRLQIAKNRGQERPKRDICWPYKND